MFRFWLTLGALNMLLALIVAAAVGHKLESNSVPAIRTVFDTARDIHFVHALALVFVGILADRLDRRLLINLAGWAFLAGIIMFCGGLYAAFGAVSAQVKPMIPLGGLSLMAGWIFLALAGLTMKARPR